MRLYILLFCLISFLILNETLKSEESAESGSQINSVGVTLPEDAVPPSKQNLRTFELNNRYMDRATSSYQKSFGFAITNEPLTRVDRDFNLVPAAAKNWEVSDDGHVWVFHLRKNMIFGDGKPVTAYDYEDTFHRWANPKTGFDFEWYYRSIRNWGEVVAGQMPLDSLGVKALDPFTLAFTTTQPAPFAPLLLNYSWVTPTHQFEKYGPEWSTRPETHIGNGPYKLKKWTVNHQIILEPSPTYNGPSTPYLEKITAFLYNAAAQPPFLSSYESGEVDYVLLNNPAEINRVKSDSKLRRHLNTYTNFTTYYLMMDTRSLPFSDLRVRKALAHAIDQQGIIKSALKDLAVAATSMIPPGFPAGRSKYYSPFQAYDPERARVLLADAGYPDGQGFPVIEMWLRGEAYQKKTAAVAIQAMLKQNLNIEVIVHNVERKVYTEALNAKKIQFSMIAYGWDYIDPSNLLNIWLSRGRHPWHHTGFENLVGRANMLTGKPKRRLELYQEAEEILVQDVGGIFLWHDLVNEIWQPYIRGEAIEPNQWGYKAWRGNQMLDLMTTLYIADNSSR
tara:strand:+ start:21492 stop:23180 length:1689 start_codon:yes stop_codon:yes gene_type:complete